MRKIQRVPFVIFLLLEAIWGVLLFDALKQLQTQGTGDFGVRDLGYRVPGIFKNEPVAGIRGDLLVERDEYYPSSLDSMQLLYVSPFQTDPTEKRTPVLLHLLVPRNAAYGRIPAQAGDAALLPLLHMKGRRFYLEWLDVHSRLKKHVALAEPSIPFPSDEIGFQLIRLGDLDRDGRPDVLFSVDSGFLGLPRGLFAHDAETGEIKFEFITAGVPFQSEVGDFNRDGKNEILLSLWSPHNGVVYGGQDDDHAVLVMLDETGKPIWTSILGGFFSEIRFVSADLDGDGRPEIVTARACHRANGPDPGELNVIDSATGRITATFRKSGASYTRPFVLPSGRNGRPIIAVADSTGLLSLFDASFSVLKTQEMAPPAKVLGIFRPEPGGRTFLVVSSGANNISVMDERLRPRFRLEIMDGGVESLDMVALSDGVSEHAVVNADRITMLTYAPRGILSGAGMFFLTPFGGLLLLGFGGHLLAFHYGRLRRRARGLAEELAVRERSQDWTVMVQEIVHRMKTPLFTVQLEAEKLAQLDMASAERKTPMDPTVISESILDDISLLKKQTRQLMQLAAIPSAAKEPSDIVDILRRLGENYRLHLSNRIEISLDLPAEPVILPIHAAQIQEALANLIDNAVDAVPEHGRVRISAQVRRKAGFDHSGAFEIDIEDNGCGISPEAAARVFESSFTTKPGSLGLGLPIARRIIEGHGGTIQIQSRPQIGTRIAITLPWKGR